MVHQITPITPGLHARLERLIRAAVPQEAVPVSRGQVAEHLDGARAGLGDTPAPAAAQRAP